MNRTLLGFLRKEFVQVLRDPRMRILLFIAPIIQMTIFGVAISNEVRNVRLAGYFKPNDTVAKDLYERCQSSTYFIKPTGYDPDPYRMIQSDKAEAVFIAPPGGLTKSIGRGQGQAQLLINSINVIRAQEIEAYVKSILNRVLIDDKFTNETVSPISLDVRVLYNPDANTAYFMVPAVISMLLCIITVVLTSMSLAKEKEVGTFETLIAAPVKTWEVILGKTLPYIVLGTIDIPFLVAVACFGFGVPLRGPLWMLFTSALIFLFATVSIGTLISTFAKTQQQAMMAGFLFLFPAVMLSGLIYPVENMPEAVKVFSYFDPIKYFVSLLRNIMLKGGGFDLFLQQAGALILIALVCTFASFRRFRHTL